MGFVSTPGLGVTCFVLSVLLSIHRCAMMVLISASVVMPGMGVMAANAGPAIVRPKGPSSIVERSETPFVLDPKRTIDQE